VIEVELFVAVLGASNYTYAEARARSRSRLAREPSARLPLLWRRPGRRRPRSVEKRRGGPVPLRAGAAATYEQFAQHFGTVILPARRPTQRQSQNRSRAWKIVERWILARLRHERFFSLAALNARIAELLEALNARPMRLYRASRRELFERVDRPQLRPLPAEPFVYGEWKIAPASASTTTSSCTALLLRPYALIHELVDACVTATTVELFHRGSAWPPMSAASCAAGTRPIRPICRRPISATSSGRPRGSSPGRARSARRPPPSSRPFSLTGRIPSRATAPASGSCGSPNATARPGSRPRVPVPSASAPAPTATSTRSSSTASTGSRGRRPRRHSLCSPPRAPPRARVLPRRGRSGGAGTGRRGRECVGRGRGTYGRPQEPRS